MDISGIVDSTSEFFQESIVKEWLPTSATLTFQFSVNISDLSQPLNASIQNMEWTHPILGPKFRIPSLTIFALRGDQGWMGQAKSQDDASVFDWIISTTDGDFTRSKWKIDYTLALQDLTKWFSTSIPHATPLGTGQEQSPTKKPPSQAENWVLKDGCMDCTDWKLAIPSPTSQYIPTAHVYWDPIYQTGLPTQGWVGLPKR